MESPHSPGGMAPLHGVALSGPAWLRLLVASNPPTLVDVDTDTRPQVTGLPAGKDRQIWVEPVGDDAVITSSCADCWPNNEVFYLRRGTTAAQRIATGSHAAPSLDSRGVWLKRYEDSTHCTLREVNLDGQTRTASRPISCRFDPRMDTPLGVLVAVASEDGASRAGDALLPVGATSPSRQEPRIYAVVGHHMLTTAEGDRDSFVLTDEDTGSRTKIPRPTAIGIASDGLASPDDRYLVISFEEPAWPGPTQRMDLWLLDLISHRWQQLPSMPTPAALKATATAWTSDGRLVLLGDFDDVGQAIALWPGDKDLQIRRITLPEQRADAFVAWPS